MRLRRLLPIPALVCVVGSCLAVGAHSATAATPPTPTYGTAVVDGNQGEWNLSSDFYAPMYNAGKTSQPVLSNGYLRYDCSTQTLYVLVMQASLNGSPVPLLGTDTADAWATINGSSTKMYTGSSGTNTNNTPPEFAWIGYNSTTGYAQGYEASFSLAANANYTIVVHVHALYNNVASTSAFTGFGSTTPDVPLDPVCSSSTTTTTVPPTTTTVPPTTTTVPPTTTTTPPTTTVPPTTTTVPPTTTTVPPTATTTPPTTTVPPTTTTVPPTTTTTPPAPVVATVSGSQVYGSSDPAFNSSAQGGSVSGTASCTMLTNGDAITAGVPVGFYTIDASSCSGLQSSDGPLEYAGGPFVVTPAPLTITASSPSMTYGSAVPDVTASYAGFVNGDDASSLTTSASCSSTAGSSPGAGAYPTSCSGATDANYSISYLGGSLTVNPAPLTITASSPSMTYGSAVPDVKASYAGFVNGDDASSLTIAPTCTTAATSASSVGTYPTSCAGAADPNYSISYVPGMLTVASEALTITASSPSMTYGSPVPAVTPAYDGFVNGDNASSLTTSPACSTTATSGSPVASYPTSCTGAVDPNYSISYVNGTLNVTPAPLTITASSETMTYGSAVPTVTPSYDGFVDGDNASSLTTPPTCSTTATSGSPVASYPTTCAGAVDDNYTITNVPGDVTVNPAQLTVTASSGRMIYGSSVPGITPSYQGFVNGDTTNSLTTAPSCSSAATSVSPVGRYPTVCGGAADDNYAITYITGDVAVRPAPLVVTASSASMTYRTRVPRIGPSYQGFVNGDSPVSLTRQPTCNAAARVDTPVGRYPTACSGAFALDYRITYRPGVLKVVPAPTNTTVRWVNDPIQSGSGAVLIASVGPAHGDSGIPTGSVRFSVVDASGNAIAIRCGREVPSVVIRGDRATCPVPEDMLYAEHAPYRAVAVYGGDTNFTGSHGAALEAVLAANLTLTKAVSNARPAVGGTDTFTLTVQSAPSSTMSSGEVVVRDDLASGLVYEGSTPSSGSAGAHGQEVTWSVPDIAPGDSATLVIAVKVATTHKVTNVATFTQSSPSSGGGTSGESNTVTVEPVYAVLTIKDVVRDPTPLQGASDMFTDTVTNEGPFPAAGVVVTSPLPAGVNFSSDAASYGPVKLVSGAIHGKLVWSIGDLAVGQAMTMQVGVDVTASGGQIIDEAVVTSSTYDPTGQVHDASAGVVVAPAEVVPGTHTGLGWASWIYWLVIAIIGGAGAVSLGLSRRRRLVPIRIREGDHK